MSLGGLVTVFGHGCQNTQNMHEYIEQDPHQRRARGCRGLHVDSNAFYVVPYFLEERLDGIVELANPFGRLKQSTNCYQDSFAAWQYCLEGVSTIRFRC